MSRRPASYNILPKTKNNRPNGSYNLIATKVGVGKRRGVVACARILDVLWSWIATLLEWLVILAAVANVTVHGVVSTTPPLRPRRSRTHPHPGSTCNILLRPSIVPREPCGPADILVINACGPLNPCFIRVYTHGTQRHTSIPTLRPDARSAVRLRLPTHLPSLPATLSLSRFPAARRANAGSKSEQHAHRSPPPRLPRRPTMTATTPSALAILAFLYGASSRTSTAVEMEVERRAQMGSSGAGDLDVCVCSCILASTKLELGMGVEKARVHRALALVIGSGCAQTWPVSRIIAIRRLPEYLLRKVCRILLGLGMGPKASTVPVFTAANTPASIRGGLVISSKLRTAFGIFLGFCANLALTKSGELHGGCSRIRVSPLMCGVYLYPESPRWVMKTTRYQDAYASFRRLRNTELQAADLYYVHHQLMEGFAVLRGANYFTCFFELFTIPRVRRASLAAFIVRIAQQMCGMDDTR
ncbi:hypothetical protein B0H14DRAFT_3556560 [Mycena olivaceomarginata]|nr:hypothetical protein B0H14DRAFT_3556560 [Mycena olivaceomarginata]